jgi:hypothetical protein
MGWSAARRVILAGAASATWVGALDAQWLRHDSTAVTVTGSGSTTYVLLSGLVGGVAGFRRLASELERDHRVRSGSDVREDLSFRAQRGILGVPVEGSLSGRQGFLASGSE